jgi:hypothetical protein
MKAEKMRNFAIVTAVAISLATTSVLFASTQSVFSYDKNQATSETNACGNDFLPINIGCQNTGSNIQGDENAVALTAQQTFPEFLQKQFRDIPRKIVDGFLTIKEAIIKPFGAIDPPPDTMAQPSTGGLDAFLKTHGLIPQNGEGGAFGYGILTENTETGDGSLIVATTHAGVLDSVKQADINDPIMHNHMVMLGEDATNCGTDPAVVKISWLQPGSVHIEGKSISLTNIPNEFSSPSSFNPMGSDEDYNPGNVVQQVVSFKLVPVPSTGGSAPDHTLQAVCVTDITPAENLIVKQ